jgi:hypothetical protein
MSKTPRIIEKYQEDIDIKWQTPQGLQGEPNPTMTLISYFWSGSL